MSKCRHIIIVITKSQTKVGWNGEGRALPCSGAFLGKPSFKDHLPSGQSKAINYATPFHFFAPKIRSARLPDEPLLVYVDRGHL